MAGFAPVPRPSIPSMSPTPTDISAGIVTGTDVDGTVAPKSVATRIQHLVTHVSGAVNAGSYESLVVGGDWTAAIQAAIDAAVVSGAKVIIPKPCLVSNVSATEVLRIPGPVSIEGPGGLGAQLIVKATVPGTADVLHYVATTSDGFKHLSLRDLAIIPESGTPGRYAINIDTTTGPIANFTIEGVTVEQLGSGSITNTNPSRTDGWFTSLIQRNFFVGGIAMSRAGDSIRILNNTITGNGIGIDWDAVAGTNVVLIAGNNITSKSSAIRLRSAYRTVIRDNNIEPFSGGGYSGAACIDVSGSAGDVYEPRIFGNTILASLVPGVNAITFDHVLNPWVGPNTIYVAGVGVGVTTTANTVGLRVDRSGSAWAVGPTRVTDGAGDAIEPVYMPLTSGYSVGTFTPSIEAGGQEIGTYATRLGRYVRFGRRITADIYIQLATKTRPDTGAGCAIVGLPVAAVVGEPVAIVAFFTENIATTAARPSMVGIVANNSTQITLFIQGSAVGPDLVYDTTVPGTASLRATVSYDAQ